MEYFETGFLIFCGLYCLIYLILLVRTGKPFKTFFINAVTGLWAMAIVDVTAFFTGAYLPLNLPTFVLSSLAGIPGCIAGVIARYIFLF